MEEREISMICLPSLGCGIGCSAITWQLGTTCAEKRNCA